MEDAVHIHRRISLTKASLLSLLVHYMSLLKITKSVVARLDQTLGLGLGNLSYKLGIVSKVVMQIWEGQEEREALWRKIIAIKYGA